MSTDNVLVIGGGGREHALCWKLAQSLKVGKVFVAPGNPGIASEAIVETANVDIKDHKAVAKWCHTNSVSLVVVGPENPLNDGISDALSAEGLHCFGPSQAAAQIECNKDWAKSFMDRNGLPTARWKSFRNAEKAKKFIKTAAYPALVVKGVGLAEGKGVVVASSQKEACDAVKTMLTQKQMGSASKTVFVEELLQGEEVSVLGFSDGKTVRVMLPVQDHKRLLAGDNGPNTGGMGAYCPAPFITQQELQMVEQNILAKTVTALAKEGTPFVGVLSVELMLTKDGPKILKFNCCFGDPETQVILTLLNSDLHDLMLACCEGKLASLQLEWRPQTHAVGVVLASQGYPASSGKSQPITGIAEVSQRPDCQVFHSGTQKHGAVGFATNGGRVLIAVSLAPNLSSAAAQATKAAGDIKFEGAQFRKDIAKKGIARYRLNKFDSLSVNATIPVLQVQKFVSRFSNPFQYAGFTLISEDKSLYLCQQCSRIIVSKFFNTTLLAHQDRKICISSEPNFQARLAIVKSMYEKDLGELKKNKTPEVVNTPTEETFAIPTPVTEGMIGLQIVKNGRVEFALDTITKKTIDTAISFLECQQDIKKNTTLEICKNGRSVLSLDSVTEKTIHLAIGFLQCLSEDDSKIEEQAVDVDTSIVKEETKAAIEDEIGPAVVASALIGPSAIKAEDIGALQQLPQKSDANTAKRQRLAGAPRPQAANAKGKNLQPVKHAVPQEHNVAAVQAPALSNHGHGMAVYLQGCSGFTIGGESYPAPKKQCVMKEPAPAIEPHQK